MHQRDRSVPVLNRILEHLAHEAFGAFARDGFNANRRSVGKADFGHTHLFAQKTDDFFRRCGFGWTFSARVKTFRIFTEYHDIGFCRFASWRGRTAEITDWPQTYI